MKKGAYVGIDPGKNGAAALWRDDNKVWLHDFKDLAEAVSVIRSWAANCDIKLAALEKVQSFPRDGHVGAFRFGENLGQWRAILECLGIPRIEPTPAEWKKSIPPLPIDDKKRKAVAWCIEVFPGAENFLTRLKDADRAEALLLARYARDWDRIYINRGQHIEVMA
jgi:hypothetical protein